MQPARDKICSHTKQKRNKFASEDKKTRFGSLPLGIFSLLSRGRKVLDQISKGPKYFCILPYKLRGGYHITFQHLHTKRKIFFNTLENWKDHLLRHEKDCTVVKELSNDYFCFVLFCIQKL